MLFTPALTINSTVLDVVLSLVVDVRVVEHGLGRDAVREKIPTSARLFA